MATERDTAQTTYERYCYSRTQGGHDEYLQGMETAQRYYASRQWEKGDVTRRTNEGRLSFTVNEIFRTINAVRGELFNLSTDVRFAPGNGGSVEVANILNKVSAHIDYANDAAYVDDQVRLSALLGGRGYWEVRMDFDDNLQGNVVRTFRRPQNVILDADIDSPDPAKWDRVMTTDVVSLNDLSSMFGARKVKDIRGWPSPDWLEIQDRNLANVITGSVPYRQGTVDESDPNLRQFRMISEQYRDYRTKEFFIDLQTGDMEEIPENWSDAKIAYAREVTGLGVITRKAKTIRWRVVCNDRVLHDEDSPYGQFTIVPYFPFWLDGQPVSLFSALKGPQDMLNYTVNEEMQILGTTSHSGWKVKQGSLKNMTMRDLEQKGAKNGLVMELEDIGDAERITPGQPATGFERLGDRSRNWIMELASVTPAMLGAQSQYAPGKGMDTQLSRAPVNLSAPLIAYQFSMGLLAKAKLNLIQTYYTEERTMFITNAANGQAEELVINQIDASGQIANDMTIGSYMIRQLPATSRTAADEYAFDELIQLKELGLNVPNSLFVLASSLQAKPEMIEVLIEANNGEISPEEQRQQELALRQMEADVLDTEAGAQQKQSAAELNQARAAKNIADASYDPRAEANQINRDRLMLEDRRANRQLDQQDRKQVTDTGLKLTEIAENSIQNSEKAKQQQQSRNKTQPRRGMKK